MVYMFITTTDNYNNQFKIKKLISDIKKIYEENVTIITRGNKYGLDGYIKELCDFNSIQYFEIPPFNMKYVKYQSLLFLPKFWYLNKYKHNNIEINTSIRKIIEKCNNFIVFINKEYLTEYDNKYFKYFFSKVNKEFCKLIEN